MTTIRTQSRAEAVVHANIQCYSGVVHSGPAEPCLTLPIPRRLLVQRAPTKIVTLKLHRKALVVRLKIDTERLAGLLSQFRTAFSFKTRPLATRTPIAIDDVGHATRRYTQEKSFTKSVVDLELPLFTLEDEHDRTYRPNGDHSHNQSSTPSTRSKKQSLKHNTRVTGTVLSVQKRTRVTTQNSIFSLPEIKGTKSTILSDVVPEVQASTPDSVNLTQSRTISDVQVTVKKRKTWNKEFVINNKRPYIFDWTPFPDHESPTLKQCETVGTILAGWAEVQSPKIDLPRDPEACTIKATGVAGPLHAGNDKTVHGIFETILSQATGNENAIAVRNRVREKFPFKNSNGQWVVGTKPNYHAVRKADVDELVDAMGAGGLQNGKAKDFKTILDVVYTANCAEANRTLPDLNEPGASDFVDGSLSLAYLDKLDMEDLFYYLVGLPRVGVKTAACILQFNYRFPILAVDTHVMRLAHLLGWIPSDLDAKADRNLAAMHLDFHVPEDLKWRIHQGFWHHGQLCYRCTAKADTKSKEWAECICPLEQFKVRDTMIPARPRKPKLRPDDDTEPSARKLIRQPTIVAHAKMSAEKAQELGYKLARDEINDSFMAGASTGRTNVTKEHTYWVKETVKVIRG